MGFPLPDGFYWRRGTAILTDDALVERAKFNGWQPEAWRQIGARLYPALEEELARHTKQGGHIVLNESSRQRYTKDALRHVFAEIRDEAGLPKAMTFTGFRHGGATELGDVGIEDIRSISGHKTLGQTTVYNKVTERKARRVGEIRRAGIEARKA